MSNPIKEYKQKDGKVTYYFNTYLGTDPITGERVRVTRRGFKTKKEAKSALLELQYKFDKGILKTTSKKTYENLYHEWIKVYSKGIKEVTLSKTKQKFRDHILPTIGHLEIDKITGLHCQQLYSQLSVKLKGYNKVFNYAKTCYQFAITPLQLVSANPFDTVYRTPDKKEPPKHSFLEVDELKTLLECIKEQEDYMWYALFTLIGYTGMRKSEALALTWDDLDNNQLTISKTMSRSLDGSYVVSNTPKTEAGNRIVTLDSNTLAVLKKWQHRQKIKTIDKLMFTNSKGKHIINSTPLKVLDRVNERNKLKRVTVHDLRRTHVCHLFDAGIGVKEVQERVGQSDISTTMQIYNFVTDYRKEKSLSKFEDYIGNISS